MKPYTRYYPMDPEGGTAMVEFVIVFPMWVLMTLGIMQLALMHAASNVVQVSAFVGARSAAVCNDSDLEDIDTQNGGVLVTAPIMGMTLPADLGSLIGGTPVISNASEMKDIKLWIANALARKVTHSLVPKTKVIFFNEAPAEDEEPTEVEPEDLKEKIFAHSNHDFELLIPVVNNIFVSWFRIRDASIVSWTDLNPARASDQGPFGSLSTQVSNFSSLFDNENATIRSSIFQAPHAVIQERAVLYRPWAENDDYREEKSDDGGGG